jgi:hypothetical protein
LTVICYYGYNNHFNPGSGSVPGSSNIDDMTGNSPSLKDIFVDGIPSLKDMVGNLPTLKDIVYVNNRYASITNNFCLGADLDPGRQVICQMSNSIVNRIHWCSHSLDELVTLPDNQVVYLLNHIPPAYKNPDDYLYAVIKMSELLELIIQNNFSFSNFF